MLTPERGMTMHFSTTNLADAARAVAEGYALEGVPYWVYPTAMSEFPDLVALNRLYHDGNMDHFYCLDAELPQAKASGYVWEGVAGWVFPASLDPDQYAGLPEPLYRTWQATPPDHFYTMSKAERDSAVAAGYSDEGTICRVFPYPPPIPFPQPNAMLRLFKPKPGESSFWDDLGEAWADAWGTIKDVAGIVAIIAALYPTGSGGGPDGGSEGSGSGTVSAGLTAADTDLVQANWRWCNKCQALTFAGGVAVGQCPAGGGHDHTGSGYYQLVQNVPRNAGQPDWRWCNKCQALTFAGGGQPGACSVGGEHDHAGSGNYSLVFGAPTIGQSDWRWCNKCQALTFSGGGRAGACSAGGEHDHAGSGTYSLAMGPRVVQAPHLPPGRQPTASTKSPSPFRPVPHLRHGTSGSS